MSKKEKILLGSACFFAGMVAGFLIAPIKKGVSCGNNNGNNLGNVFGLSQSTEEEEEVDGSN